MTSLLVKFLVFKKNFERKKSSIKLLKLFRFCSYWTLLRKGVGKVFRLFNADVSGISVYKQGRVLPFFQTATFFPPFPTIH